jgi:metallo-beta-lactamase family protein
VSDPNGLERRETLATEIYSWGAAGEVTGSKHFLETPNTLIQVDCGIFQGRRQEAYERNRNLPYEAGAVDACVLTHAHLDHCGNLPTLVRSGFTGPIYATPATVDITRLVLLDSAHIQEGDAGYAKKLSSKERRARGFIAEPLYTREEVERTMTSFRPVDYGERREIAPGVHLTFYDAGHILGSAMALLEVDEGGKQRRIVFGGDMGRKGLPILRDPQMPPDAHVFVCESTYGDRLHDEIGKAMQELGEVIRQTSERGGKVVIPAFAIGRTQELIFFLHLLTDQGSLPPVPIFVDSPMAVTATSIFRSHPECYDEETREAFLAHRENPFGFERLKLIQDVEESKKLNALNGPAIIISSSGMAEGGRILHHLMNTIEDPRNTVLVVGFMAQHTLGRRLADRNESVRIFGQEFRLRARVKILNAFSAHADYDEIRELLSTYGRDSLRQLLLVHGEPPAQEHLTGVLGEAGFRSVTPVRYDERYRV